MVKRKRDKVGKFKKHTASSREESFWLSVDKKSSDKCWPWLGAKLSSGYGLIYTHERRRTGAHRFSYIIHKGEIPDGMFVCHTCDNPKCVNPAHLFLGTPKDNAQDKVMKMRHLHTVGENQHLSKLTREDVLKMRKIKGISHSEIAKMFDVSRSAARAAIKKETWKHI